MPNPEEHDLQSRVAALEAQILNLQQPKRRRAAGLLSIATLCVATAGYMTATALHAGVATSGPTRVHAPFEVVDSQNRRVFQVMSNEGGDQRLSLFDVNGIAYVELRAGFDSQLKIYGRTKDGPRVSLGIDAQDNGYMSLYDKGAKVFADLGIDPPGNNAYTIANRGLTLFNGDKPFFAASINSAGAGSVRMTDSSGNFANLTSSPNLTAAELILGHAKDKAGIVLQSNSTQGAYFLNPSGNTSAFLGLKNESSGYLELDDQAGKMMVEAGRLQAGKGYVLANPYESRDDLTGNPSVLMGGGK